MGQAGDGKRDAVDESRDSLDRLTTAQAAVRLGISEAGVRKRVQRGQMQHDRDEAGRLWVYLDTSETAGQKSRDRDKTSRDSHVPDALVSQMQARIDSLERQLDNANERDRENRRIIAALTSRIPELEAPSEMPSDATESPETVEEEPEGAAHRSDTPSPQTATQRGRSLWRRVFGR